MEVYPVRSSTQGLNTQEICFFTTRGDTQTWDGGPFRASHVLLEMTDLHWNLCRCSSISESWDGKSYGQDSFGEDARHRDWIWEINAAVTLDDLNSYDIQTKKKECKTCYGAGSSYVVILTDGSTVFPWNRQTTSLTGWTRNICKLGSLRDMKWSKIDFYQLSSLKSSISSMESK